MFQFAFRVMCLLALPAVLKPCSIIEIPLSVNRSIVLHISRAGAPAAHTEVFVTDWRGERPELIRRGQTDLHGSVEFDHLPIGQHTVASALWPPFEWTMLINVKQTQGTTLVTAAARAEREPPAPVELDHIQGVIFDPSGAIVPNAVVVAEEPDFAHTPAAVTHTDNRGHFALADVRQGYYVMRIGVPRFQTAVVPILVATSPNAWLGLRLTLKLSQCGVEQDPYSYTIMRHDERTGNAPPVVTEHTVNGAK